MKLLYSFERLSPFAQNFLPRFLLFVLVFSIFLFPIIHANFRYNDDWFHIGHPLNALQDGRPVQQIILYFSSAFATTDLAPLLQILGMIAVAAGATLASLALNYKTFPAVLLFSFLFCNDFFLENLSYRYDAAGMGGALGISLAAFYIPTLTERQKYFFQWAITVLALTLAFGSYQPTVNVYGGISCLAAAIGLMSHEKSCIVWRTFSFRITAFSTALIISRIVVAIVPAFHSSYSDSNTQITLNIFNIWNNYLSFFHFFLLLIKPWENSLLNHGAFLLSLIVLGAIALLYQIVTLYKIEKNIFSIFSIFLFLSGIFLFFAGPMVFIKTPVLVPRVMTGIPVILMASANFLITTIPKQSRLYTICNIYLAYLIYSACVASFAYGNASYYLEQYRLNLDKKMADDLEHYLFSPEYDSFKKQHIPMDFAIMGNNKRFYPDSVRYVRNKYPIFQSIFLQPPTWKTAFPAMGFDIARLNLIGAGEGKFDVGTDVDLPFLFAVFDTSPKAVKIRKYLQYKVSHCDVDEVIPHFIFFTYRIGSFIIFDYNQTCISFEKKYNYPRKGVIRPIDMSLRNETLIRISHSSTKK